MTLRETKKRRTRERLVATALALFTERGVAAVSLDELCAQVEVSKRTFFRYFPAKEAVAIAPLADMWAAFLDALQAAGTAGRALVRVLADALDAALVRLPAAWAGQAVACLALVDREPSVDAAARALCVRTTGAAVDVLRAGRDAAGDVGLVVDVVAAAFVATQREWIRHGDGATVPRLRELTTAVPQRLERALTLRA